MHSTSAIEKALENGTLDIETLDQRVLEVLNLLMATGKFEDPEPIEEQAIINPEHGRIIREAGAHGMVLLKNQDDILPLEMDQYPKIAALGLAKTCLAHGGGSASVNAHYKISPYEALELAIGDRVRLVYAEGAHLHRMLPKLTEGLTDLDGRPGLTATKYSAENIDQISSVDNVATAFFTAFETEHYSKIVLEGTFTPPCAGNHYLEFHTLGAGKLLINDKTMVDAQRDSVDPMAFLLGCADGEKFRFHFEQGKTYKIMIESKAPTTNATGFALFTGVLGVGVGLMTQAVYEEDLLEDAIEAAKSSDLALVFVGNTNAWESEGHDMETMNLPADGSQDRLIDAVADVNPNTVVINSTGVPIAMPWLPKVKAVLQAWYPGQEAGNSMVDVLTGVVNPCGRLPVTFPHRLEDTPAYSNFPGDIEDKLEVNYAEGSFIGYRHYNHHPEHVLFPFGFGLSFSKFTFANAHMNSAPDAGIKTFTATIDITNTSSREGNEVLQVYATAPLAAGRLAQMKLVGFDSWRLVGGQTLSASISFLETDLAEFDEDSKMWVISAGEHLIEVSTSASKDNVQATFWLMMKGCEFKP